MNNTIMNIKCKNCGYELSPADKFCPNCRTEIISQPEISNYNSCPVCGNILKEDVIFCNNCGVPLYEQNIQQPLGYPISKKKQSKIPLFFIILLITGIIGCVTKFKLQEQTNSMNMDLPSAETTENDPKNTLQEATENLIHTEEVLPTEEALPAEEALSAENLPETSLTSVNNNTAYLFPSDQVYINVYDLYGLTKEDVALIRNEIYARHGYIFNTEPFKSYFVAKEWYVPNVYFNENLLNEIEKANKDFIVEYEKAQGWR